MSEHMTAAQTAQQNNRDGAGKYATKAVDESGTELDVSAPSENLTLDQWEKKVLESLSTEDKDKIVRFAVAHAVYLASKAEWDSEDNFAFTEGAVEQFKCLTEMPPEGSVCDDCGVVYDPAAETPASDDYDFCANCRDGDEE